MGWHVDNSEICVVSSAWSTGKQVDFIKYIQSVPGGNVNILGGHSIGHSKQKCLYEHVSYSERFPR